MDTDTDALLRLAFERVPAAEATHVIERIRVQEGSELSWATSYELVLPAQGVRHHLLEHTLPRLVNHLESTRAKLPDCPGVFLSVFAGDMLHFIRARDAVALLSQWSGLSTEELRQRYGPR